jgi:hypothetical protein
MNDPDYGREETPQRHLEPQSLPPIAEQLLNAMALLIVENHALKDQLGQSYTEGRAEFGPLELRRGSELGPLAMMQGGTLVVRLEI